jgi:RNase P subunit RPR2
VNEMNELFLYQFETYFQSDPPIEYAHELRAVVSKSQVFIPPEIKKYVCQKKEKPN